MILALEWVTERERERECVSKQQQEVKRRTVSQLQDKVTGMQFFKYKKSSNLHYDEKWNEMKIKDGVETLNNWSQNTKSWFSRRRQQENFND